MRERPLPQLTIQQLDYLIAVADHATWAEAAASLGVTPSALSQGLAELERRLGFGIFERQGRRRMIAESSGPVVNYARSVIASTSSIARWIDESHRGSVGSLRLGMIDAAAIGHYGQTLRDFRETHTDVDFTLTVAPSGELLELLANGALDVAVVVRPLVQPTGIEWTEVLVEPLGLYAPPGTKIGQPETWGPWVSFATTSHTRQLVAHAVAAAGAPFEVIAESNQPDVLREMVRLGMGWTVLPVIQAETQPSPLLRARPKPLAVRTLVAARRAGSVRSQLADTLLGLLLAGTKSVKHRPSDPFDVLGRSMPSGVASERDQLQL